MPIFEQDVPFELHLYFHRGDLITRVVEVTDESGASLDFSGTTVEWTFAVPGESTISATAANGRLDISPVSGRITLTLDGSITDINGIGRHELKITSPYIKTLLNGVVVFSE